jgi:hypothetical protein
MALLLGQGPARGRVREGWVMGKVLFSLGGLLVLALLAGAAYLAFVDVPVQHSKVEKVLPDERFPR